MAPVSTLVAVALSLALARAAPAPKTSGKRGLAYNSASLANLFSSYDQITWAYNWGLEPQGLDSSLEYVPMLWGDPTGNQGWIDAWNSAVQSAIAAGTQHIIAFNEPDLNGLSPAQAAVAWNTYVQPYAGKVKLGAPAVTNGGAPWGIAWLDEFMVACKNCTIDFVPFHWYCSYETVEYFTDYVQEVYEAVNKPLWLTEFQAQNIWSNDTGTDAQQTSFIETVVPWLDSVPYVHRYSYFGVFESSSTQIFLLNSAGTGLSHSGKTYASISNVDATVPDALVSTPPVASSTAAPKKTTSSTSTTKTTKTSKVITTSAPTTTSKATKTTTKKTPISSTITSTTTTTAKAKTTTSKATTTAKAKATEKSS